MVGEPTLTARRNGAEPAEGAVRRPQSGMRVLAAVAVVLVAAGLATGTVFRLWFLLHEGLGADEATIGLMARAITHGHFSAFFWGQDYGGAESYVVALGFLLSGASVWVIKGVAIALFGVAAVLTYFLTRRVTRSKLLGFGAATIVWAWPEAEIWNSTRELGFRCLTLTCGLGCLACCVRVYDSVAHGRWERLERRRRLAEFGLLGALAGVGWWASLEITYFLVPSAILLGAAVVELRARRARDVLALEFAIGLAAAVAGALPWIWGSVLNRFGSIDLSTNSGGPPESYSERLSTFFHVQLPLILGFRLPVMVGWRRADDNAWINPEALSHAVYILILVGIVAVLILACRRGAPGIALGSGLLAFPFLYAASASSSGGVDGRYGVYFIPLLVVTVMVVVAPSGDSVRRSTQLRRLQIRASVLIVLLIGAIGLTVAGFVQTSSGAVQAVPGFTARWGDPDAPITAVVDRLRELHVKVVIADYWEGGDIGFIGGGTPGVLDVDLVRNGATNAQNLARYRRFGGAWLFFPPGHTQAAAEVFGSTTPGPYALTQGRFTTELANRGVSYRIYRLGLLDAVVPSRPVVPSSVGIPAWTYELPPGTTWVEWAIAHTATR